MPTLFTKIIKGEIPCHKIYEDDQFFAFLDIRPLAEGHTLVIPKEEIDYIFDLKDDLLADLMVCAKKIALAIKKEIACERVGIVVAGLEVPHTHIHLIPMNTIADLNFANAKETTHNVLTKTAESIRKHLE